MERSLVVLDDGAQHDAVAAAAAALIGASEMVSQVVAADENVWQAIRVALTRERFDVVVLAVSSTPDPRFSREVARIFGLPVVWIPASVRCRAGTPDDPQPERMYRFPGSGTDVRRDT